MPQTLYIQNECAAGDVVVLSAIFRDLQLTYPGEFELHYVGHCKSLFANNPHVAQFWQTPPSGTKPYRLLYESYLRRGQIEKRHFLTAFPEEFTKQTGIPLELLLPKGDLYLSEEEKNYRPYPGRYWVIFAGRKYDFTTKLWSVARWQQLVDALARLDIHCVQTGGSGPQFWNPDLTNVTNTLGTDLRQLMAMIYHADGVICPITSGMHIAAALDKPCVVIAGGREAWWWESYVNSPIYTFGQLASGKVRVEHRYLHTQDQLPCCIGKGCWRNKVSKAEPDKYKSYCDLPVDDGNGQQIPQCLHMISVPHVLEAVMSYYDENGNLKPIGPPPEITLPDFHSTHIPALPPTGRITIHRVQPSQPKPAPVVKPAPQVKPLPKTVVAATTPLTPEVDPYDNPIIGGSYTIFVLMYGNDFNYHTNCLNSILSSTPKPRRAIRIGCNVVGEQTQTYLSQLLDAGQIEKVYWHRTNDKKYPVMRQMFHDPDLPIRTNYLVWFDDDTTVVDPLWGRKLSYTIINDHPVGCRLYGQGLRFHYHRSQMAWIKTRPWYRGRQFRLANGNPAPNGDFSHFAAGWFWAMEVKAMCEAGIPDEQLGHNGGDYMLAEQLWQAGYTFRSWNTQKQFVSCPKNGRRGLVEIHTGMPNWVPGGCT